MADNVTANSGTGGAVFATDDIASVHYPRSKLSLGADGAATDAVGGAGAVGADTQRVTLASDDPAVTALQILDNAISGSEMQVDVVAALPAGTNAIGKLAANSGVDIGDVDVTSIIPGTGATNLGKAVDTATGATDTGVLALATRDDALSALTPIEGDNVQLRVDANGALWVHDDALDAALAGSELQVDIVAALPAGTNAIGKLASNTGVTIGAVEIAAAQTLATVTTVSTVTAVTTLTGGGVAHDGADSGNPVKIGGRAVSAEIAAVANNDRADFVTDLVGKQIVMPYANPENFVSGAITTAMTGTTSTSLIAAPGAGLRNYITQITVSCAHATQGTDIIIQDGSGGTTLYTIPAAALYGGAAVSFPVPLRQPTTNTAIFCANVTTGSSTKVSASGYKGA